MILPELRLLEAAIAVAHDLNFSRAAERLHIDQSTVTKRINALESQLGFKLFERDHQSVELTEPGRRFVEEAQEAVMHMERAVSSASAAFRGAEETLNIGATAATDPFLVSTSLCANISETSRPSTITVGRGKKSHCDEHNKQDEYFFRCVGSFGA